MSKIDSVVDYYVSAINTPELWVFFCVLLLSTLVLPDISFVTLVASLYVLGWGHLRWMKSPNTKEAKGIASLYLLFLLAMLWWLDPMQLVIGLASIGVIFGFLFLTPWGKRLFRSRVRRYIWE